LGQSILPSWEEVLFVLLDTDRVLQVEALTSVRTQLPYEYYVLPFCRNGDLKILTLLADIPTLTIPFSIF
jgi:hypothetical protein